MSEESELELTKNLGKIFDQVLESKYGMKKAPEPFVTPTGIRPLDALLGGGIVSSGPVLFTSTPETGKSTYAFQFSSIFQKAYPNSIILYIDIEGSGNVQSENFRVNRVDRFGLDTNTFKYCPLVLDMKEVFDLIRDLIQFKNAAEAKKGCEFKLLIVWDSIASTRSSKTDGAESHDQLIGFKARELSHYLEQTSPLLKYNRITLLGIDQVRSDIKIDRFAKKEKSVGVFKDMKSATNVFALLHNTQQWLFFSKGQLIGHDDKYGLSGWTIDIHLEKNKLAPSQFSITCLFDKNSGISKFWSEYYFLANMTPSEKAMKMTVDLPIKTSGAYVTLNVKDENGKSLYKTKNFYRKNAKEKYETDKEFRQWFDYAVDISVYNRIINGVFNYTPPTYDISEEDTQVIDEYIDVHLEN